MYLKILTFIILIVSCAPKPFPIIPEKGIAIVEYGTNWCPACKEVHVILEKICTKKNINLILIDAEENKEKIKKSQFYLHAVPIIAIYKDGKLFYYGYWFTDKEMLDLIDEIKEKT